MTTTAAFTLTERQKEVLRAIRGLTEEQGYPPTLREIGALVGLASASSVHYHVQRLERAGLVTSARGRPRARAVPQRGGADRAGVAS